MRLLHIATFTFINLLPTNNQYAPNNSSHFQYTQTITALVRILAFLYKSANVKSHVRIVCRRQWAAFRATIVLCIVWCAIPTEHFTMFTVLRVTYLTNCTVYSRIPCAVNSTIHTSHAKSIAHSLVARAALTL